MKTNAQILQEVGQFSPRERAAAIAHYIYALTAERVRWGKRVPTEWHDLPDDAREFNIASIDTWANERDLRDAWHDALQEVQQTG
jgi:hypothetical protein